MFIECKSIYISTNAMIL